ncbi:MAG: T9SS type A sorting domain-containing protein, partial [Saprospiraceae bacterium]|nr:T9SS type A sorting domain-containing protein [Saprospiraceae bacterium]
NSTITKNDIEVFPNPFLNRFEIEGAEFDQISIWGLDGKLIKLIKVDPTHHHEIDIQSLSSGAYYIEIRRGNGSFDIKKIVKR